MEDFLAGSTFGLVEQWLDLKASVEPPHSSTKAIRRQKTFVPLCGARFLPAAYSASLWGPFLPNTHSASPLARNLFAAILFSQGESSGSGGRAREGRNGGGGSGNQGIGGGGGQREDIGNERRGNRGSNHGGGNVSGDDDGNGRGAWVDFIEGEYSLAKILLFLNAQMFGTLMSLDIHGLPARARIFRVVSLGFNLAAIVCLWDSFRRRRTNPILARILSWIGSLATLLAFISMIAMAIWASFIP